MADSLPKTYDDLPDKRRYWPATPNSADEGLGMLRLLTPEIVANAARTQIQTGERVCLNWDLEKLNPPGFGRKPFAHHVKWVSEGHAFDDEYHFNPQQSSQWDGLRHHNAPAPTPDDPNRRVFYGGTTSTEILDPSSTRIGIAHWAKKGIAGRGVLIDYASYVQRTKGVTVNALTRHTVSLDDVLTIAKECNITFEPGDILFLRVGLPTTWDNMTDEERVKYSQQETPNHAGLEQSERVVRFLWDQHFAAVAGDAVSFEQNHHGREVSQPPGLTGEKHHHHHLTFDTTRSDRAKSKSRSKHKHKHSKSGDFRFHRRMNNLASSAGSRGLLPTWSGSKEKDNDADDGLLRPITQETTWSRWSSDSTAALGSGSRKGSLLDVIDPSNKLGPIRRQEIRSMEDLEQVKSKRKQGEEYLRSALSMIGTLATDITRRLDYTYYNLLEKLAALNSTIASFQELSSSTSALFDDFQRETSGLDKEIRKQMGELKEFQPQLERIKTLEGRMKTGRQRAEGLNNRLAAMRHEIDRWDKKELEWQSRVNRRLRVFWTVVVAGMLAVLLAIAIQNWPTVMGPDSSGLPSQALFLTNSSHALPPENDRGAESDSSREAWPRSLRNLPYRHTNRPSGGSVPVVATATRDDTNVRTTDPDPLTIFDEL